MTGKPYGVQKKVVIAYDDFLFFARDRLPVRERAGFCCGDFGRTLIFRQILKTALRLILSRNISVAISDWVSPSNRSLAISARSRNASSSVRVGPPTESGLLPLFFAVVWLSLGIRLRLLYCDWISAPNPRPDSVWSRSFFETWKITAKINLKRSVKVALGYVFTLWIPRSSLNPTKPL